MDTADRATKHTPGPWKAHFEEAYFVTGPDLGRVAMMMNLKGAHGMGGRRSGDESAANARLIAAAPELLAACLTAHEVIAMERQSFADCNNVPGLTPGDDPDNYVEIGGVLFERHDADVVADYDRALAKISAAIATATGSAS